MNLYWFPSSIALFSRWPRLLVYKTVRSQSDGWLFEVPHFSSMYKSTKHFGLRFAYDAPRIRIDMPDDEHSAKSLFYSERS